MAKNQNPKPSGGVKPPKNPKPKNPKVAKTQQKIKKQQKTIKRLKKAQKRDNRRALQPIKPKRLKRQAKRTVRAMYKPAMQALRQEEKKLKTLHEKRTADNAAFRDWLTTQTAKRDTAANAQAAAALASAEQAKQDTVDRYGALRSEMIDRAAGRASTGSSDMSGYTGFNVEGQGGRALERAEINDQIMKQLAQSSQDMRTSLSENTMAMLAAAAATAQGEHLRAMQDVQDARMRTRAERASKTVEYFRDLQDREIEKAKTRADIRNQKRDFRLRKAALKVEKWKAKLDARTQREGYRSAEARARTAAAASRYGADQRAKGSGKDGPDKVNRRDMLKNTRRMNGQINSAIYAVKSNPKLKEAWRYNKRGQIRKAFLASDVPPWMIPVIFDLMANGKLSPASRKVVRANGGLPKRIQGTKVVTAHPGRGGGPGSPGNRT